MATTEPRERKNAASRRYKARRRGEAAPLLIRPFTPNETLQIMEVYGRGVLDRDGAVTALALRLGRSPDVVMNKARSLGLAVPATTSRAQSDSTRMAVSLSRGRLLAAGLGPANSRAHGGRRADLGDRYFRSTWEANYARYLNWRGLAWEYETKTFRFEGITRGTMSYTPDFWVPAENAYHEIKGWMDQRSRTQLARMGRYHPSVKVIVVDKAWFRSAGRSGLSAVVPGWEALRL